MCASTHGYTLEFSFWQTDDIDTMIVKADSQRREYKWGIEEWGFFLLSLPLFVVKEPQVKYSNSSVETSSHGQKLQ